MRWPRECRYIRSSAISATRTCGPRSGTTATGTCGRIPPPRRCLAFTLILEQHLGDRPLRRLLRGRGPRDVAGTALQRCCPGTLIRRVAARRGLICAPAPGLPRSPRLSPRPSFRPTRFEALSCLSQRDCLLFATFPDHLPELRARLEHDILPVLALDPDQDRRGPS